MKEAKITGLPIEALNMLLIMEQFCRFAHILMLGTDLCPTTLRRDHDRLKFVCDLLEARLESYCGVAPRGQGLCGVDTEKHCTTVRTRICLIACTGRKLNYTGGSYK